MQAVARDACPAWDNRQDRPGVDLISMQILNTLTVLALVVMSFALIVAVPVLYASNEDSAAPIA